MLLGPVVCAQVAAQRGVLLCASVDGRAQSGTMSRAILATACAIEAEQSESFAAHCTPISALRCDASLGAWRRRQRAAAAVDVTTLVVDAAAARCGRRRRCAGGIGRVAKQHRIKIARRSVACSDRSLGSASRQCMIVRRIAVVVGFEHHVARQVATPALPLLQRLPTVLDGAERIGASKRRVAEIVVFERNGVDAEPLPLRIARRVRRRLERWLWQRLIVLFVVVGAKH